MGTLSALLLHLKVYLIFFNILHAWLIKLGVMWNCYFIVNLMKLQATTVAYQCVLIKILIYEVLLCLLRG
jgi:hypothetical protein